MSLRALQRRSATPLIASAPASSRASPRTPDIIVKLPGKLLSAPKVRRALARRVSTTCGIKEDGVKELRSAIFSGRQYAGFEQLTSLSAGQNECAGMKRFLQGVGATMIDKYDILDFLGKGGFGIALLVQNRNKEKFAIKAAWDNWTSYMTAREEYEKQRVLADLHLAPPVYEFEEVVGPEGDKFALTRMGLVDLTMDPVLRAACDDSDMRAVTRELLQACAAVAQRLESANIFHGDFHPGNIALTQIPGTNRFKVQLIDFGRTVLNFSSPLLEVRNMLEVLEGFFPECVETAKSVFARAFPHLPSMEGKRIRRLFFEKSEETRRLLTEEVTRENERRKKSPQFQRLVRIEEIATSIAKRLGVLGERGLAFIVDSIRSKGYEVNGQQLTTLLRGFYPSSGEVKVPKVYIDRKGVERTTTVEKELFDAEAIRADFEKNGKRPSIYILQTHALNADGSKADRSVVGLLLQFIRNRVIVIMLTFPAAVPDGVFHALYDVFPEEEGAFYFSPEQIMENSANVSMETFGYFFDPFEELYNVNLRSDTAEVEALELILYSLTRIRNKGDRTFIEPFTAVEAFKVIAKMTTDLETRSSRTRSRSSLDEDELLILAALIENELEQEGGSELLQALGFSQESFAQPFPTAAVAALPRAPIVPATRAAPVVAAAVSLAAPETARRTKPAGQIIVTLPDLLLKNLTKLLQKGHQTECALDERVSGMIQQFSYRGSTFKGADKLLQMKAGATEEVCQNIKQYFQNLGTHIFDNYRIIDFLGQGTYGMTVLVRHLRTNERSAVKIVSDNWTSLLTIPEEVQMQRAFAAAHLGPEVYEYEEVVLPGSNTVLSFIRMAPIDVTVAQVLRSADFVAYIEEVPEADLTDAIRTEREQCKDAVRTLLEAVMHLAKRISEANLFHGDFHNGNIALTQLGSSNRFEMQVIDFGRALENFSDPITETERYIRMLQQHGFSEPCFHLANELRAAVFPETKRLRQKEMRKLHNVVEKRRGNSEAAQRVAKLDALAEKTAAKMLVLEKKGVPEIVKAIQQSDLTINGKPLRQLVRGAYEWVASTKNDAGEFVATFETDKLRADFESHGGEPSVYMLYGEDDCTGVYVQRVGDKTLLVVLDIDTVTGDQSTATVARALKTEFPPDTIIKTNREVFSITNVMAEENKIPYMFDPYEALRDFNFNPPTVFKFELLLETLARLQVLPRDEAIYVSIDPFSAVDAFAMVVNLTTNLVKLVSSA